MGDNKYWSKVHPHLTNVPLRTVYLMPATQEKEVQRNDKSSAKPSHFVTPSRVDPVRSNFGKDIMQRKTKSNIQVGNKTEKPHTAAMVDKRYRLSWTCTCGHKGLDHYIEHRPGAVRELLETFQEHGIKASMEACDLPQSNRSAARIVFERLGMTVANICTWIRFCILAWLGIEKWTSPSLPTMYPRLSDAVHNRSPSSKASNGPTNGISSSTSSANVDPNNSNQPLRTLTGLSTASQATPGRQKWRSSSSTTCTQVNSTNINIPEDFILLCIKVKRFLTNRHDLQVSTITRDRELFEALRREYHSKFRWAYCRFSFQTIQRMSFVKFTLHARQEVDGLVSDMPPETVKHYTCDPRKPDRTPPLGSDFLMHRFSSPKDCFQDNICLRQFPKRIRERPTPGVDPDLYTGWGVHLEQDMDLQRICLVLFFGIASAGTFGLVWGICKRSLQDGFSIASFVLGSEAIAVATLQLFLTFGAI
ncbi:hypothetical protein COCSADRAFT_257459 [Bipolaris sorokiniana ND90Pr]|nr:uncharacterized protein COCSADRAFT_257459 [Bipolaris sorokiniana ND90Pr]EMD59331.1 hypothetical protein COCSADRAFT_257459 [Bipolaris sorokiniana ND90Pr]